MQANVSLILNIILLVGVVVAIARIVKSRRQSLSQAQMRPSISHEQEPTHCDDIIAIRRINLDEEPVPLQRKSRPGIRVAPTTDTVSKEKAPLHQDGQSIMMFLLAKENRQLAGYELLQTVLACGLRFGEGNLFHRHQSDNGQGPVVCSLAAATASGVFDLQNIGAFSVRGLCLFMHVSGHSAVDAERFAIMHDTATRLCEGLDTYLLDDQRNPLNEASLARYREKLNIGEEESVVLAD